MSPLLFQRNTSIQNAIEHWALGSGQHWRDYMNTHSQVTQWAHWSGKNRMPNDFERNLWSCQCSHLGCGLHGTNVRRGPEPVESIPTELHVQIVQDKSDLNWWLRLAGPLGQHWLISDQIRYEIRFSDVFRGVSFKPLLNKSYQTMTYLLFWDVQDFQFVTLLGKGPSTIIMICFFCVELGHVGNRYSMHMQRTWIYGLCLLKKCLSKQHPAV